jgi:hypothetical protein
MNRLIHYWFVFFIISISALYAQSYQYMNLSESETDSKEALARLDTLDDFRTFWIENQNSIRFRSSSGTTWNNSFTIYQSNSEHSISALTSCVINDTNFVFFNDDIGDSTHIVYCGLYGEQVVKSDTIHTIKGSVTRFRSAINGTEIAVGYAGPQCIYVYKYPQGLCRSVSDTTYYWAKHNFSLAYDKGDTLWAFCIWNNVWSRYLTKEASEWSGQINTVDCGSPVDDIDCKYNTVSQNFNLLILTERASCTDCIENKILYSQGYSDTWSACETVDPGGNTYMAQGRFNSPFLEIASNGKRNALYTYNYSSELSGDEYSVRTAQKEDDSESWEISRLLLFNNSLFTLTSTAISSKDSVFFTYTENGDVYLAAKDNPSSVPNKTNITMDFRLFPSYPNPFNPSTTIRYQLPTARFIHLAVYTALGEQVAVLYNGKQTAGLHSVQWNGQGLPSGIYFYRMVSSSGHRQTRKMVLIR